MTDDEMRLNPDLPPDDSSSEPPLVPDAADSPPVEEPVAGDDLASLVDDDAAFSYESDSAEGAVSLDDDTAFSYESAATAFSARATYPEPATWKREDPPDDGADIDLALAAVASLSQMVDDREADAQAQADVIAPAAQAKRRTPAPHLAMPPMVTLKRGHLGSLVPGVLLIAGGAYWTFLTTTGTPVDPLLLIGAALGFLVVLLLIGWLSFGRWARGLLFFAIGIAAVAGVVIASLTVPGLELTISYPLLFAAPGLAFIATGVLSRPASPRLLVPGILLWLAAAVGIVANAGLIPLTGLPDMQIVAAGLGGGIVIIWVLALLSRRRA